MKSRASRLLSLYGLFSLLVGVLGILSEEQSLPVSYTVLAAIGAGSLVCSFAMKKDSTGAFAAAPAMTVLGLLAGLWYGVGGWIGVVAGESGIFLSAVLFSFVGLFSVVVTPTLVKTWRLQQRFYNLFDNRRE